MPNIDFIRKEIERYRVQVQRQRREILQLQKAGLSTVAAEGFLQRMLDNVDALCARRDKLRAPNHNKGRVLLGGRSW